MNADAIQEHMCASEFGNAFLCNIVVLIFKVYLFKNINSKINKENINDNLD